MCVLESEGNGRMCTTLPRTLITVMGIEKVLPRFADLEVMLQLLPRSSTAERMNPYTSLWTGVTPGDGPQEFHLVLLDAGRTDALADPVGREALHCIRCSACLNVCPVYERTGGHAYGSIYPGPIGAILTPQLQGLRERARRCHGPPRCAAPATRSARSRSTSRRSWSTCADAWSASIPRPRRRPSARRCGRWPRSSAIGGAMSWPSSAARAGAWPLSRDGRLERRLPGPLAGWTAVARPARSAASRPSGDWWRERAGGAAA